MSSLGFETSEQILDRFDEAWNGPTPPRIEDYLTTAEPQQRLALLIELVRIDLERRLESGERVRVEETYSPQRFPELYDDSSVMLTLVKHEFEVRRRNEPELTPTEYVERFPHCLTELLAQLPTLNDTQGDELREMRKITDPVSAATELDLRGYQLIETLGKGGMGEVYRCCDPALGRDLAIKVMKVDLQNNPEVERRFLREARVTGSLQHPGIVAVHNLGRLSDGRLHYTMRLVRGRTLAEILKKDAGKPEGLPSLLAIFEKVCEAVAYAHSKHVIHRDLKPTNIMVGRFGEVQVMDWGLAKLLSAEGQPVERRPRLEAGGTLIYTEAADTPSDLTRAGTGVGTPAYMSPEQAQGEWELVDERTDVFALGAILCVILTGQPPYRGENGNEILRRAKRGDLTEAFARLEQCAADQSLTSLCCGCLAPEREGRPRDAAQVAQRVATLQAEVQERLRRAELERARAVVKADEERKRRRLTVVLASAVLLAILAGGGGFLLAQRQKQARQEQTARLVQQALGQATALRDQALAAPLHDAVLRERAAALWRDTLAAADRAERALADGDADAATSRQSTDLLTELRRQGAEAEKDRNMLRRLEQALELKAELQEGDYARKRRVEEFIFGSAAAPAYAAAFREYGIDVESLSTSEAVERIRQRPIRFQLAVALDDWYFLAPESARGRLLDISRAADPDPLRDRVRRAVAAKDRQALKELAESNEAIDLPVPTLILLADVLHEQGLRSEGVQLLKRARSRHPDDGWVNDVLGLHLESADPPEYAEAARCFAATIALRPTIPIGWSNLGAVLTVLGRLDEAVGAFREAIRIKPDFLTNYAQLGMALIAKGELDEALAMLQGPLRRHPNSPMLRTTLGDILNSQGKADEAIALYRQVLTDHPEWVQAQIDLAYALSAKGSNSEALEILDQILHSHPDLPHTYQARGWILMNKGDVDAALAAYRKAAKLGPGDVSVWSNLAGALAQKGQHEEALRIHRKAIHLAPENAVSHSALADSLYYMGRANEAETEYRMAIRFNPRLAAAHYGLGLVLYNRRRFKDAEQTFRKAISLRAQEPWYHAYLGLALRGQKDYSGAAAAIREAIRLKPDECDFHNYLGHVPYDQARYAESIPHYREAVRLGEEKRGADHPSLFTFRNNLANAYRFAGRTEEAIRLYKQILKQREAKLGPDHLDTLQAMTTLGVAYRDAGQLKDAIHTLETALQRGRNLSSGLPADYLLVPADLAEAYDRDGQFTKAEAIYRDLLALREWLYGSDDRRAAGSLVLLGNNLLKQKKYSDAEPLLRQCLKVREAKQPDDWRTFNARSVLGESLLGQKKLTEAEPLLMQGYEGMKQRQDKIPLAVRQLRLSEALERLAQFYEATNKKEEAAKWRKQLGEQKAAQKKPKS